MVGRRQVGTSSEKLVSVVGCLHGGGTSDPEKGERVKGEVILVMGVPGL